MYLPRSLQDGTNETRDYNNVNNYAVYNYVVAAHLAVYVVSWVDHAGLHTEPCGGSGPCTTTNPPHSTACVEALNCQWWLVLSQMTSC